MNIRIALAVAGLWLALTAAPAAATIHEYCFWDGSFAYLSAGTKCYQSGDNYLLQNYAYLTNGANGGNIYCGANQNGSQYGNVTAETDGDCRHTYGGGNLLKAWEYVAISDWTHGVITY